jgi:hypothetical protein
MEEEGGEERWKGVSLRGETEIRISNESNGDRSSERSRAERRERSGCGGV